MKTISLNIKLLISFIVLLSGIVIAETFFVSKDSLEKVEMMKSAAELAGDWFDLIHRYKYINAIESDVVSTVPNSFMIGDEWSEITSTLGSLEVKEISSNPDFAALMVRFLNEAGISSETTVGVIASGSFPSLLVSSLAALQVLDADVILMSSLCASTYGANQPYATWIDMESTLQKDGGLSYSSCLVSIGAGHDMGVGISAEGLELLDKAAERNSVNLFIPASLKESIDYRVKIFDEKDIALLINIGGNEAAMGSCPHSWTIPNGLNYDLEICNDEHRGVISRMSEKGIPFINLLNIKNIALQYGIDTEPGTSYAESAYLYSVKKVKRFPLGILLIICLVPVWFLRRRK